MSTASARVDRYGFLERLFAPARWLERAKGRKRVALAGLYSLIIAIVGCLFWRAARLAGIPDTADPVDLNALYAVSVPKERNAFVLFEEASAKALRDPVIELRILSTPYALPASTDQEGLAFLARNAEALAVWRRGCQRPDALSTPLNQLSFRTKLPVLEDQRHFVRLALLESSRLESCGQLDAAWDCYRDALRGSRLVSRHGTLVALLIGCAEYAMCQAEITRWAADPRVDSALLRRALEDVQAVNAMSTPISQNLKIEYLCSIQILKDPIELFDYLQGDVSDDNPVDVRAWYNHLPGFWTMRCFLQNEPEHVGRLTNLTFANWLAQCDRLPSERPAMIGATKLSRLVYDSEPPRGAIRSTALVRHIESNALAKWFLPAVNAAQSAYDRDRAQRARLVISLAEALYQRRFGKPPASHDDLIGPCLDQFPDGYARGTDK